MERGAALEDRGMCKSLRVFHFNLERVAAALRSVIPRRDFYNKQKVLRLVSTVLLSLRVYQL